MPGHEQRAAHSLRTTPFWWEDVLPIVVPVTPLPAKADVVVVGSGYTGLSAALALVRAGRSVVVLESGHVAEGASSRNGGMCGDQLKPSFSELAARFGTPMASRLCCEARDALAHFQPFLEANSIRCEFVRSGRLTGALSEIQLRGILRESEIIRRHTGAEFEWVDKANLDRELGTEAYVGARLYPHHGGLDPARYASELARCLVDAGGVIRESTAFLSSSPAPHGFSVRTSAGDIRARDLVIATNGYSDRSGRWLRRRLVPVTSYMITTDELPAGLMSTLMPRGRMVTDTNRLLCYYRPSPDRKRILFGGRPAYTAIAPEASARRLGSYLRLLFPALENVRITHSWSGMIAYTFDRLPHVGTMNGIHYAGGYCGSGVVMATWLGNKLAQRMLGLPAGRSAFSEVGHPAHALYFGRPWFLPFVQAWYQAGDRWERRERGSRRS